MASISKRGLFWRAQIRTKGYPSQSRTFDTRAAAEKWARLVESEMDRGIFIDRSEAERTSLSDALDRYGREITPSKRGQAQELRKRSFNDVYQLVLQSRMMVSTQRRWTPWMRKSQS